MRSVPGKCLRKGILLLSLTSMLFFSTNLFSQIKKFPPIPNGTNSNPPNAAAPTKAPETAPAAKLAYPVETKPTPPAAPAPTPETQLSLPIELGAPIQTAEGTTLTLANAEVKYTGTAPVKYQWQVVSGPADKMKITNPAVLKAQVEIGNLDAPTAFLLRLQVSAGNLTQAKDLQVNVYPAKLYFIKKMGGGWIGVDHMGDKWVAARSSEILIFDAKFSLLTKIPLKQPIAQFFPILYPNGKSSLFIQTPEGNWSVLDSDPVSGNKKTELLMLGSKIRRVVPFDWQGSPYIFALLPDHIELWNLSDPTHPKLKSSIGTGLKNPLYLAFADRLLYVADETSIHLLEYPSGNLIASVPSGGSITSLSHYQVDNKNFLLTSIGQDRSQQGRKDYALRIFELDASGRLGSEHRISFSEVAPIERATVIPNQGKGIVSIVGKNGVELRLADLRTFKEIPLQGESAKNLLPLFDLETGLLDNQLIVVAEEAAQLKVIQLQPQGEPATSYNATSIRNLFGMVSAAWLSTPEQGDKFLAGDEGTTQGGSLAIVDLAQLEIRQSLRGVSTSYPVSGKIVPNSPFHPVLFRLEKTDPKGGKRGEAQLGLLSGLEGESVQMEISSPFLEKISPQSRLRGIAVFAKATANSLRMILGLSGNTPTAPGGGVLILDKLATQSAAAVLNLTSFQSAPYFPIPVVRDVTLNQTGKTAYIAAGEGGIIALDLETKQIVSQMKLNAPGWIADRVVLSKQEDIVFVSFLNSLTRIALIKVFGIINGKLQEYGTIPNLSAIPSVEGIRAPKPALTQDDLYLFTSIQPNVLAIFNLSNPSNPTKIHEVSLEGEIRNIAIANRYRDIFVALGPAGIVKLMFGF